jgi:hypothetical protein
LEKNGKKWQKSEKPKIAHEIYRKTKNEGHASSCCFFGWMHFSTKKKTQKLAIEGILIRKKAIEISKNHENLQKNIKNHDF